MNFVLPVLAFAGLTAAAGWAWWVMTRQPRRWELWVDTENDFWRDQGFISAARAEQLKLWEKGRALKWLAAATALAGAIGMAVTMLTLMKALSIEHHKLGMPYNPALQARPAARPHP